PIPPASAIIMPITVSQGFNELVGADVAVYFSNVYSQELRNQAEHRIDRLGQKFPTITHVDLCGDHMGDAEVITALQCKNFSPERANAIVNKYAKPRRSS